MWYLLLGLESVGICIVTWWLLKSYAVVGTPFFVLLQAGIGWACCFFIVVLVPSDISTYIHNHTENDQGVDHIFVIKDETVIIQLWRLVYWITFFWCWMILPVTQSYNEAAEFKPCGRFKRAMLENVVFYALAAVLGIGFIAYLSTVHNLTGTALIEFVMALANAWGLTLLVLCLGYGLVEIPKMLYRQCNDETNLRWLQFEAISSYEDLKEWQLEMKISALQLLKDQELMGNLQPEELQDLQPHMEVIVSKCPPEQLEKARTDKNSKRLTIQYNIDDSEVTYNKLVRTHRRVWYAAIKLRIAAADWDVLCHEAWEYEDVIKAKEELEEGKEWRPIVSVGQPDSTGAVGSSLDKAKWIWKVKLRRPCTRVAAVACTLLSLAVIWLECVIAVPSHNFRLSWLYYVVHSMSGLSVQIGAGIPFLYMVICTYYSLFALKLFSFYALKNKQQTEGPNLLFNAALLCRLAAPLSFNYLQCIDEKMESSYIKFMGAMNTVPLFGDAFNLYVPIFISLICVCTACNCFSHCAKLCPGRAVFREQGEDEDITQGQEFLERERKQRARHALYQGWDAEEGRQHKRTGSTGVTYDQVQKVHSDLANEPDDCSDMCGIELAASDSSSRAPRRGSNAMTWSAGDESKEEREKRRNSKADINLALPVSASVFDLPARGGRRSSRDGGQHSRRNSRDDDLEANTSYSDSVNRSVSEPIASKHHFGAAPKQEHTFGAKTTSYERRHTFGGS